MLRFAITAGCLLWASTSLAQFTQNNNSGGSTGYGAFGSRSIGGGINSGSSGFSSGQTSSMGSSGMGSSGYGNSSMGGSSMGGSSMGGGSMGGGSMGGGSQLGGSPTQGFTLVGPVKPTRAGSPNLLVKPKVTANAGPFTGVSITIPFIKADPSNFTTPAKAICGLLVRKPPTHSQLYKRFVHCPNMGSPNAKPVPCIPF